MLPTHNIVQRNQLWKVSGGIIDSFDWAVLSRIELNYEKFLPLVCDSVSSTAPTFFYVRM